MKTHGFPGFGRTGFGRDEIYPELSVIPIKLNKTILSHVYSMFIPWMWVCHVYFTTYDVLPDIWQAHGALEGPSERRIQGASSKVIYGGFMVGLWWVYGGFMVING